MKTTHTFGIQFILRTGKKNKGMGNVYARVTVETRRIEISLKKTIAVNEWNNARGIAKGATAGVKKFNIYLEQVRSRITEAYRELQVNKEPITPENIKALFLGDMLNEHSLIELIDYHNSTQQSVLAPGTMKNYYTTKRYIEKFIKKNYKSEDIYLVQVNYKFITDFETFLRNHQPLDHQRPIGNNGVMKHQERFRKMINLGVRLGWINQNPFESYRLKFKKVTRECLDKDELLRIEKKKINIERLNYVRDLFVFSCYTGLCYADVMLLAKENIRKGVDGELWIFTKREKTDIQVPIPLLAKSKELIERYQEHPRSASDGTIFPRISNQRLNSYLKELAAICKVSKNLTFHLARHTFATTVTLSNGVPIESVSRMLGHSKLSTTQVYAKVIEEKLSRDMNGLKQILDAKP